MSRRRRPGGRRSTPRTGRASRPGRGRNARRTPRSWPRAASPGVRRSRPHASRIAAASDAAASPRQSAKRTRTRSPSAAQPRHDAGVEERALADAALAEEEREPGREHVRDDELGIGVAAEEVRRVLLLVPREPLVRGLAGRAPRPLGHVSTGPRAARRAPRRARATYSSSGRSRTSTPRSSQNSRSSSDGRS